MAYANALFRHAASAIESPPPPGPHDWRTKKHKDGTIELSARGAPPPLPWRFGKTWRDRIFLIANGPRTLGTYPIEFKRPEPVTFRYEIPRGEAVTEPFLLALIDTWTEAWARSLPCRNHKFNAAVKIDAQAITIRLSTGKSVAAKRW